VENVFDNHTSVAFPHEVSDLFKIADSAQVRFTLDTGHAQLYGCLFDMLDTVGEHLAFTHIHDNDGSTDQHYVPGHGTINWIRFMRRLDVLATGVQ
jgi:sugar phosphate isomerase/epimerase